MSVVDRIRTRLDSVIGGLARLLELLPVRRRELESEHFVFICPEYFWGEPSAEQRATQLSLKMEYEPIEELLRLLLSGAPQDLTRQLKKADTEFRVWLELESTWSLTSNPSTNLREFRSNTSAFKQILDVLGAVGSASVIVVPDTNGLLSNPEPASYRSVLGLDAFTFTLLPTVLGELDRMKTEHRNDDVREKAKKVITRIKGWRLQGSLSAGVTVDKTITVNALHNEPNMRATLSWLDANVPDDRIIASILALQASQPGARVVLVTGDINLQNKADAALIETVEAP